MMIRLRGLNVVVVLDKRTWGPFLRAEDSVTPPISAVTSLGPTLR